jgi:lysylphosphatidylglycerol synthetase-like protein (DUF2156 family)
MSDRAPRPLFGFLFTPRPAEPGAPQTKWMRVPARGPLRLLVLIPTSVLLASILGAALFAIAGVGRSTSVAWGLALVVLGFPVVGLVLRAWIVGTYVCDSGVRITRWWRTDFLPWPEVTGVRIVGQGRGATVVLDTIDGAVVPTTVTALSADTAGRVEAWHIAADRMRTWWHETR